MAKTENEIINKVEKNAATTGAADNIDRVALLKAGTVGSGKEGMGGGDGGVKHLDMTDPFKKCSGGSGVGEAGKEGSASKDSNKETKLVPGGGGGNWHSHAAEAGKK